MPLPPSNTIPVLEDISIWSRDLQSYVVSKFAIYRKADTPDTLYWRDTDNIEREVGRSTDSTTFGLLSVTDDATGRKDGDEHYVTSGPMAGAIFELTSGVWVFKSQTRYVSELDSTGLDWPISAADVAAITPKMTAGQAYWLDVVDHVQGKFATVEVRQNGFIRMREHAPSAPAASAPTPNNPLVLTAGAFGASVVFDSENGLQETIAITGTLTQITDFTVINLPEGKVMHIVFDSPQANAPTFSGAYKLNPDPVYNARAVVVIAKLNGQMYRVVRVTEP